MHECLSDAVYARTADLSTAPSGTTPAVAYRHKAMRSLRATATMPTSRPRFRVPKCSRYHRARALPGCQRTHVQAS